MEELFLPEDPDILKGTSAIDRGLRPTVDFLRSNLIDNSVLPMKQQKPKNSIKPSHILLLGRADCLLVCLVHPDFRPYVTTKPGLCVDLRSSAPCRRPYIYLLNML